MKVSNLVHVEIAAIDVHLSKATRLESIVDFPFLDENGRKGSLRNARLPKLR
jgi:hypothetical protein